MSVVIWNCSGVCRTKTCVLCPLLLDWYTVEPRNADTNGTNLKCPDYRGVLYSGVGTFYHYNEDIIY